MDRVLLIEVGAVETRSALIIDGDLIELRIEASDEEPLLGSIWRGRVKKIVPGLQAAFVDFGQTEDGFLSKARLVNHAGPGKSSLPIERLLHEGQKIPVEVIRLPFDGKGASLSMRLSRDIDQEALQKKDPPFCLWRAPEPMIRSLDDYAATDIEKIIVEPADAYQRARRHLLNELPDHVGKITYHSGETPLFVAYDLEGQIDDAFARDVLLPSGGLITIETTKALTAIDVDTAIADGQDHEAIAFQVNYEAALEIAKQIRLRDIGGLIVVDFIQMKSSTAAKKLITAFQDAVKSDPSPIKMTALSELGLVELARRRRGPALTEKIDPLRRLFASAWRAVERAARHAPGYRICLEVAPSIAAAIAEHPSYAKIVEAFGPGIDIRGRNDLPPDVFEVMTER